VFGYPITPTFILFSSFDSIILFPFNVLVSILSTFFAVLLIKSLKSLIFILLIQEIAILGLIYLNFFSFWVVVKSDLFKT